MGREKGEGEPACIKKGQWPNKQTHIGKTSPSENSGHKENGNGWVVTEYKSKKGKKKSGTKN